MVIDKIKRYCSGENVSFAGCKMDWSSLSPFQQKVLKPAMKIPYGTVETYGSLARKIGCPRGSRAVGSALAQNPFPLVIPCHRIIRGDGKPGGFSAGGGVVLKKKLLQMEQLSTQ
jgi:methylated-DNA-[protein]-cysteine S-methyltransferase